MGTDNDFELSSEQKQLNWGVVVLGSILLLASLGSLIYFFGVSVP